jgi:UDP-N-acetylglucosamine transferase subunit ALG13
MIFVTVGTELPFNRLVSVVDDWAREHRRTDVFAQIGNTPRRPSFIASADFLAPREFNEWFARSTTIIAHAGMGTILSALRFEKPILVMPRRAALGEHRNDHQLATVKRLVELNKIHVALDEAELLHHLGRLQDLQARASTGAFASTALTSAVRGLIHRAAPLRPRPISSVVDAPADPSGPAVGRLA